MTDIKSERWPASDRNRWPASYRNAWPASSEYAIWLVSATSRPIDVKHSEYRRALGVCLKRLSILQSLSVDENFASDTVIALDDPLLCSGFHEFEEGGWRWTSGRADLPTALWQGNPHITFLRVDLIAPALPRWIAPVVAAKNAPAPLALAA